MNIELKCGPLLIEGIKRNGISVTVETLPGKKRPALCVQFDGEPRIYKVASFDDEKKSTWFLEVMEDFFRGAKHAAG